MKSLILALAVYAAMSDSDGSLGFGLDVLPAVYSFAAGRSGSVPDLQLTSCDKTSCRWSTGHGVDLVAYVSGWDLDVRRLEVDAYASAKTSDETPLWFEKACLSVVAMTLAGAEASEVQAVARWISDPAVRADGGRREKDSGGFRFYGSSTRPSDGARATYRCGAASKGQ